MEGSGYMKILFVCTGNTCRSPMAEYLLRKHLQDQGSQTVQVCSGGLCVAGGSPASPNSIEALKEWGIDLSGFRSKTVSPEMIADADQIFTMTESHRDALAGAFPQFAYKIQTLKEGGDIIDPYLQDLSVYQATRDEIDAWIRRRMDDGSIG